METIFPNLEKKILEDWKKNKTFEKSILNRKKAKDFVFYEGPPTANGKPGIHHVLARTYKDIICRYKTMRGFRVLRKAGWDTHGLPVELEVEKKLGLKNKKDIEKFGIAEFNKKCKESVWQYKDEWEKLTERIGFWLDMEHPYITYENNYIESVWWAIKQIYQKGLLYEDYKVVPYCPRCGTGLSSHEVAQGYKSVKDNSVYVKFKIKHVDSARPDSLWANSYFLVWTTTPWTLPANVAIAVNPKITYVKVKFNDEFLVLSKDRLDSLGLQGVAEREFKGEKLVGIKYRSLFGEVRPPKEVEPRVIAADFVSLEDGTGLVHIAPAFGEDDMQVGKENNLPVILNVDEEGKFKKEVADWAGMFVKDADPLIIKNLQERGLLFKEELYEHDYPFCWRCGSALLYYAKESWFINMQKVKNSLIKNNEKINWVPAHLKEGRFGEWLKEVKDWAFSRERYWGTPLPVWQCKKCRHQEVIGSKEDLLNQKFTNNKYFIMRHGEAPMNTKNLASCWPEKVHNPLTKKGEAEVLKTARLLKNKNIDFIISSDVLRTKQTAEIVVQETGAKIIFEERIRELNVGIFNGGNPKLIWEHLDQEKNPIEAQIPEGESLLDVQKRMAGFLEATDKEYQNKNILIVSHELPISILEGSLKGIALENILAGRKENKEARIKTGEWREIKFNALPKNEKMELDFHRPYIDGAKFKCPQCEGVMQRVPDLIDVWFDSGSMPFAQSHYPFDSKKIQFPADYISEAIDQTRGWFYTLLAIATLLDLGIPYKNVVSLGHVLDEKGEKMSKSKGNVVNPWDIFEKYGADAARWYFYTVNQPGEVKMFSEKELGESLRKFLMIYWNCFTFYQTYQNSPPKADPPRAGKNILDKWIISRLNGLIRETTQKLDKYDITAAARAIEDFTVNDLSLWYIRRSRKRFEGAAPTLSHVLLTLSKLTAPFVPFLSEEIYGKMKEAEPLSSVHLADWPKENNKLINKKLEQEMEKVREIVTLALSERAKAGIKVRQPLQDLQITDKISEELLELIKEEINVKKISFGKDLKLNTEITAELKEEGMVRDIIRQIQDMRKKSGLKPQDKISVWYSCFSELADVLAKNKKAILLETKAEVFESTAVVPQKFIASSEITIDQQKLCLYLER
ncbi:MAG: class I tRNA ligase family protein [Patescibacteria group bacterium]